MKSDRIPRTLLIIFVSALVLYIVSFAYIQNRRTTKGPWQVVFFTDNAGQPGLLIEQKKMKISERVMFPDHKLSQANMVRPIIFDDPARTNAPFGEIIFQDLTFLPGTVTLNIFGHEVELLPRVLIVDKKEHAWETDRILSVTGPEKFKPHKTR